MERKETTLSINTKLLKRFVLGSSGLIAAVLIAAVAIPAAVVKATEARAKATKTDEPSASQSASREQALSNLRRIRNGLAAFATPLISHPSAGAHIFGVVINGTPQWRFDEDFLKKLPEVKSDEEFFKLLHTRPKAETCPKITVHLRGLTAQQEEISREAVTNDQGRYAFYGLLQGDYEVWAKLPSPAVERGVAGRTAMDKATVRVGGYPGPDMHAYGRAPVYRANLNLRPDVVTVRGRVIDAMGNPVAGAMVTCKDPRDSQDQRFQTSEGERWLERRSVTAVTNANGEYELRGIDPPEMYPTAGYLNGGSGAKGVKRIFEVQANGFQTATRTVPLITAELLDKSRRMLAALAQLERQASQRQPTKKKARITAEKPGLPLPPSTGTVITSVDFILQPATEP